MEELDLAVKKHNEGKLTEAEMIFRMRKLYHDYSVKMPPEVKIFLDKESERIKDSLEKVIQKKKVQLKTLEDKRQNEELERIEQQRQLDEEQKSRSLSRRTRNFWRILLDLEDEPCIPKPYPTPYGI